MTLRRAWVSLQQMILLKNYAIVHAYLNQHVELQQSTSPLFKHGNATFKGVPYGAYIVAHDKDDAQTPFTIAFEDGEFGDYSSQVAQQLINNHSVDMSQDNMHHIRLPIRRFKRVHRVLVLCSGT